MDLLQVSPEEYIKNESDWLSLLENETNWNKVPLLNVNALENFQHGKLVRFRGMIQDMLGPEYYLEQYEIINEITKQKYTERGVRFRDVVMCKENESIDEYSDLTIRKERQSYIVISTPAVNDWIHQIEQDEYKFPPCDDNRSSTSNKRAFTESEMDVDDKYSSNKRHCSDSTNNTNPVSSVLHNSTEHLLNFPLRDPNGKVCHLKIYQADGDSLKLNTICDVIGFLSMDLTTDDVEEDNAQFETHNPLPSILPRIDCISIKRVKIDNPLVNDSQQVKMTSERLEIVKKELLIVLTQLLCGDELAAEYLIYHLLSEVYLRKDCMALGKFSLNISNVPKLEEIDFTQELYKFIELFTTKSHYIPMSLDVMNNMTITPKKDHSCNRLVSGVLQLSKNTHLVLDETKLLPGQLNGTGVNAVRAFSTAIKDQKTQYDFTYCTIEFDCDIPFLILSEGKSMLPSDYHVILRYEELHVNTFKEITQAAKHFLKPELLNAIRMYLTLARMTEYELGDDVQEMIQNHFVSMRRTENATADDLHSLLVLARLVCISLGKSTLDEVCWRRACLLEATRKERLNKS